MKNKFVIIILAVMMATPVFAQSHRSAQKTVNTYQAEVDSILTRYSDSLRIMRQQLDSISAERVASQDSRLLANPYYYRLFINPLLYHRPLQQVMGLYTTPSGVSDIVADKRLMVDRNINQFFANMYVKHPGMALQTDSVLDKGGRIRTDIDKQVEHKATVSEIVKPQEVETVIEPIEAISRKPNFWTFKGNVSTQLQQFYFSDNWYQGGSNYNSMIVSSCLTLNYNNKEKVQFDNKLEMNLGFQTNKDDTQHKFKTNTDLLRMTNTLGIRASGRWYYSAQLQSWTQFCPKFSSNSDHVYSDFMSPFESVLSIGMQYKYSKKKFNLSVNLAPLAYDFKYVDRNTLLYNYGTRGHHSMETIGSNINANWTWTILNELSWTSRLYYFTNYKKVQVEWENTLNFTINKYLSSKLYLYPRFDDSYHSSKSDAVIQFKEYLSLGFNYGF